MHELAREGIGMEYTLMALGAGFAWTVVALAGMFVVCFVRELFRGPDPRDKVPGGRPFMTPALRESVKYFPFEPPKK